MGFKVLLPDQKRKVDEKSKMAPKSLGATEEFGQLDLREDDVPEQIEYINQFGNHSKKE